jgi:hypothetical protein
MQKYGSGDGKVLAEPDDDRKTASQNFTDKDREALAEENRQADAERSD